MYHGGSLGINSPEKGQVIVATISDGDVFIKTPIGWCKVGIIPAEEYTWKGEIPAPDGSYEVVVLEMAEDKTITFGVKQLTSNEDDEEEALQQEQRDSLELNGDMAQEFNDMQDDDEYGDEPDYTF